MPLAKPVQRSGAEVSNAPPEVVSEWLHAGELTDLMNGRDPGKLPPITPAADPAPDPPAATNPADLGARGESAPTGQITDRAQLARMSAEQIVAARRSGRLNHLLGIKS